MADPLSFDTDIAPLRRQFFPMLTTQNRFQRAMAFQQNVVNPTYESIAKSQEMMMKLQERDLAYQTAQLRFEQEKEEARLKREYSSPEKIEAIDTILSGAASPEEKKLQLSEFAFDNTNALRYDPQFNNALKLANDQLTLQATIDAKKKAEEEKAKAPERAIRNQIGSALLGRDPELASSIITGETSMEDTLSFYSQYLEGAKKAEKAEELSEKQQEFLKSDLGRIQSSLATPALEKLADDRESILAGAIDENGVLDEEKAAKLNKEFLNNPENQKAFKLRADERNNYLRDLSRLTDTPISKLKTKYPTDLELHSALAEAVDRQQTKLYGLTPDSAYRGVIEDTITGAMLE